MSGILYICGTPIGNLEDITLRQLRIFKEVDLIAAEDTRHTIKLLNYYDIKCPLTSYHEFNKKEKGTEIIEKLLDGKNIALVTDAGMPGISDPGEDIIKLCYDNNIKVTTVPGPTAVISALVLSGISSRQYVFEGFLSQSKKELKESIMRIGEETRTIILYESPHRLIKTLEILKDALNKDRKISVIREITKKYEEVLKLTVEEAILYYKENKPRGEFVLVIEGKEKTVSDDWENTTVYSHVDSYLDKGFTKKEAIKLVSKDRGIVKREVYNLIMKK